MDINEFEGRVTKLVYEDAFISQDLLIESFRGVKGFEDIDSQDSLIYQMLTHDLLYKELVDKQVEIRMSPIKVSPNKQ
jgi:hypothetical protein